MRTEPSAEQQEDSYFVSMTDLMVGMLFIFIILLMAFALNYREAEDGLKGAHDARAKMLSNVERSLLDLGVKAKIFPETGVMRLPDDLLFDFGTADLNTTGTQVLGVIGDTLRTILPCYAMVPEGTDTSQCDANPGGRIETFLVEGHSDNRPMKAGAPYRDNWELSTARAMTIYHALAGGDELIPALRNGRGDPLVAVSGYGDTRPIAANDTPEGRATNRRIDFRFLMSTPEIPKTPPTP